MIKYSLAIKPTESVLQESKVLASSIQQSALKEKNIYERRSQEVHNVAKDYLELLNKPYVQDILAKYKDPADSAVFSDLIYKISSRQKSHQRKLLITSKALYEIGHKTNLLKRKIPLALIYKVSISEKSGLLMQLHVRGQLDYLMNSFKRTNLVLFIS